MRERVAAPLLGEKVQGAGTLRSRAAEAPTPLKDIQIIGVLHDLLKRKGYTIDGAKRQLKQALKEHRQLEALRQRLEAIRAELVDIADAAERSPDQRTSVLHQEVRTYSETPSSREVISRS